MRGDERQTLLPALFEEIRHPEAARHLRSDGSCLFFNYFIKIIRKNGHFLYLKKWKWDFKKLKMNCFSSKISRWPPRARQRHWGAMRFCSQMMRPASRRQRSTWLSWSDFFCEFYQFWKSITLMKSHKHKDNSSKLDNKLERKSIVCNENLQFEEESTFEKNNNFKMINIFKQ